MISNCCLLACLSICPKGEHWTWTLLLADSHTGGWKIIQWRGCSLECVTRMLSNQCSQLSPISLSSLFSTCACLQELCMYCYELYWQYSISDQEWLLWVRCWAEWKSGFLVGWIIISELLVHMLFLNNSCMRWIYSTQPIRQQWHEAWVWTSCKPPSTHFHSFPSILLSPIFADKITLFFPNLLMTVAPID